MVDNFPIDHMHVRKFDQYRNNRFPQTTGTVARKLDASLGLNSYVYFQMNHQGQRSTIKVLDANRSMGLPEQGKLKTQSLDGTNSSLLQLHNQSTKDTMPAVRIDLSTKGKADRLPIRVSPVQGYCTISNPFQNGQLNKDRPRYAKRAAPYSECKPCLNLVKLKASTRFN